MKERSLISLLKSKFTHDHSSLLKGIGDDCAVFKEAGQTCRMISTDLLVENVHFTLQWQDPFSLGRKALNVNLSDIAAMGGTPDFVILSMGISDKIDANWLDDFFGGVENTLKENNCMLIGGDTTSSEDLVINVAVLGVARCDQIIYRSGAVPGDDIYVTGKIGQSAAGLEMLRSEKTYESSYEILKDAHLNPKAQLRAGRWLAESHLVNSMQDISDGLSTDLGHICKESSVGALLDKNALPECTVLEKFCRISSLSKLQLMLHGGEDYHLVFTAAEENQKDIENIAQDLGQKFYKIGKIIEKKGVYLKSETGNVSEISFGGFEHCK